MIYYMFARAIYCFPVSLLFPNDLKLRVTLHCFLSALHCFLSALEAEYQNYPFEVCLDGIHYSVPD